MELNKTIIGIVGLFVTLLVTFAVCAPIIDAYTVETYEQKNVGMPYAEAGGDHVIVVTADGITFDGDAVDMSLFPGNFDTYTIVYGEESFIRWGVANVVIVSDSDGLHQFPISTNTITVTISENTAVITTTASATTYSIDDVIYYLSPSVGDYVLSLNPYVNDESVVYAAGDTVYPKADRPASVRIWNIWTALNGDVTVMSCGTNTSGFTATVANTTVDFENMRSNLYRYNSVVFDYTATYTNDEDVSTDYSLTATYTYFLAPAVVEYDNPEYLDNSIYVSLLIIIPLLLAIVCVMMAVRMISGRVD